MITGDKQETAINIAIACKLVHRPQSLLIINAAGSNEAARARLEDALQECRALRTGHLTPQQLQDKAQASQVPPFLHPAAKQFCSPWSPMHTHKDKTMQATRCGQCIALLSFWVIAGM